MERLQTTPYRKPIVLNLSASAGAGKSSLAYTLCGELKFLDINAELVTEFAKDLVWEERFKTLKDQQYIFGKQVHRLNRLTDVDVIITDSPLIHSIVYNFDLGEDFNKVVLQAYHQFDNMNYFVKRVKPYLAKGRYQTAEEAQAHDFVVKGVLDKYNIPYTVIEGKRKTVNFLIKEVLEKLSRHEI